MTSDATPQHPLWATAAGMPHDPLWTRAGTVLRLAADGQRDATIIGVPAHRTSISTTNAHMTPDVVREALLRYSAYNASADIDLRDAVIVDAGDIDDPDTTEGEARTSQAVADAVAHSTLTVALGGDNSVTFAAVRGLAQLHGWDNIGLVTIDAHHDLRDGVSNGSPVRRLVEAGLPGARIAQVGISDFANSREYTLRAKEFGIHVIHRDELRGRDMREVMAAALAAVDAPYVFVDVDIDVCDRSVVPACPASVPGGLSADDLRQLVRAAARDPRVHAIDFTEVDAEADAADGRTVRLVALCVLEVFTAAVQRRN